MTNTNNFYLHYMISIVYLTNTNNFYFDYVISILPFTETTAVFTPEINAHETSFVYTIELKNHLRDALKTKRSIQFF